jgi:transposase
MIYVRRLSDNERRQLKRLARKEVGRVSERIRMILLSDRHYSVPEIAKIFECSEATVREWIERFETEDIQGLKDRPRAGRPCKADTAARKVIRQQLEKSPAACGYLFGFWTVVTLTAHLAKCFGLCLSQTTVRRVLWALDYRWRRPRHCLPRDPLAQEKMWALFKRLMKMSKDAVILCGDESDIHLLPVLRAMWMPKGKQVRIPTPGNNRKRSIFGAFELSTGRFIYSLFERKRSVEFIAFLEQLLVAYPARTIMLIVDNASVHKSKLTTKWLEEHPRLELLYLPTYSGHEENPVEKVWWRLKEKVAANRLHGDIDSLIGTVHEFFDSLTPEAALRLAA